MGRQWRLWIRGPSNAEIWQPTIDISIERDYLRLPSEEVVPSSPDGFSFEATSRGEGDQPPETVTHDVEVSPEKLVEATADYLATVLGGPLFTAATQFWKTESFPEIEAVDAIEGASGQLQGVVDTPLRGVGVAFGLSPGEAAITAGISTNLILAPITGPLDKAASFIEVAGIVIGLATGAHGLVLACIKPLLHSQLEHLLSQGIVNIVCGSHTAGPQSDAHTVARRGLQTAGDSPRTMRHHADTRPVTHDMEQDSIVRPAENDAPRTRREATRNDPLWLCLAFVPKQPESTDGTDTGTVSAAAERAVTKPVVLLMGDDAFLRTLPAVLRGSSVSEVDVSTAKTMSDLPVGRHFILQVEGIGFGTFSAKSDPQAAYQHPGCLTGRCVPPGRPRCSCPCIVCRSLCGHLTDSVPRLRNLRHLQPWTTHSQLR